MFFKFQVDQDFEELAETYDEMLELVKECSYTKVDITADMHIPDSEAHVFSDGKLTEGNDMSDAMMKLWVVARIALTKTAQHNIIICG